MESRLSAGKTVGNRTSHVKSGKPRPATIPGTTLAVQTRCSGGTSHAPNVGQASLPDGSGGIPAARSCFTSHLTPHLKLVRRQRRAFQFGQFTQSGQRGFLIDDEQKLPRPQHTPVKECAFGGGLL